MTNILYIIVPGILALLGFIVGTYAFHWSERNRAKRANASLERRIRTWEYELSYVMSTYDPQQWPTYISMIRRKMRDEIGLPPYDGKPSKPA